MAKSKKRRTSRQYYTFILACLASLIGLLVYILCWKKIPFPSQWLPRNPVESGKPPFIQPRLFFAGVGIHLQVNFVLGIAFMFFNTEKMDPIKLRKWRLWISRILVFIFSLLFGYMKFWSNGHMTWNNILLLGLLITVVNCCLLELLIQLMNQYGICNAFNLLFFTEFLPIGWLQQNWNTNFSFLIYLLIFTVFFIWITNLKWEVPVETNTLYSRDSKILKKKRSRLGFRLSFNFMPLIYLSQLLSLIYSISLMRKAGSTNWSSFQSIKDGWNNAASQKAQVALNRTVSGKGFWWSLFELNENKFIFEWKNITKWLWEKKWWIIGALLFLILLRWLAVWLQMRKAQWKTQEITKDLQKSGIYINHLAPGNPTRKLLKKIINKLVFFWNFLILVFNIIFDNIFAGVSLGFRDWFSGVNVGTELIRQIRTKYKYTKSNN